MKSAPPPPVQPPANPEPERKTVTPPPPTTLLFLPETLLERRIRSLDDNSFRLADFSGKVLVINLWASWCGPCRKEIPEYDKVRKDYLNRNVEFVGLTVDEAGAYRQVAKFVQDTGFGFILGWADKETARQLMGTKRAIPQTLVVDAGGNIVNHWAGYSPKEGGNRLRDAIDNALR
ncbi:MAG TPA: TlpA disulfide reductase family protein [Pyrinomonadaceae bacterium]|nr:TlpA disulfide reductase family protein [Pyrinomonadaceae bacterium]